MNPDKDLCLEDLCDNPTLILEEKSASILYLSCSGITCNPNIEHEKFYALFLNPTVYQLINWIYSGSIYKLAAEIDHLLNDVILSGDFNHEHLRCFHIVKETKCLNKLSANGDVFASDDRWKEVSVEIQLPKEGVKQLKKDAPRFTVGEI